MNFPDSTSELTQILVVSDPAKSKAFYLDVLGAELHSEYSGSVVIKFLNNWLLLVAPGGPTPDKPSTNFTAPTNIDNVGASFTIRVKDCQAVYSVLQARGAKFVTPPVKNGRETRAFFTDLDSHLFEISEYSA